MYDNSALARALGHLWRMFDVADQEREMAWAIERYECQKRLRALVEAACMCVTNQEKHDLMQVWRATMDKDELDALVKILKNKDATRKILNWKLIDPRH